jgi:deazaflavin-dependent oxidoreductase (nitroreductase family)
MALQGEYVPSPAQWVRDQVAAYEQSGGQQANTLRDTGLPVIVVTMRGNKSGNIRKIALMRVEHDGAYALVASKGGAPKHPVWYYNLVANPDEITIQDGAEPFEASVREVKGDERRVWWERAVAAYPPYRDYQTRTDREIPVFVAERKAS